MPSLWEACGLVAMEALCAGVPLIASDCMGLREVIQDTPAIRVKKEDAASLANGIKKCISGSKQEFVDFMPMAVERFDVRHTATQIQQMYEQVLR
ncbi:hypothetical protein BG841_15795 [Marinobacter sp. X15-166B]|nr:hypothetical protein BG841_15795 [Marinobacter sp. X15-166B]